jgi:DNA-binding CsgD family transcriptional regulator
MAAAIGAAAEAVSYADLGEEALAAAVRAVGASNALLYRYDEAGMVHGVAGTLAPAIPSYAREMFEQDPVQHHLIRLGRHPPVVLTIHDMDRRAYRGSLVYQDFYRPHGMEHLLGMWLTDLPYGAPGMAGILFTRALGEPDFAERDGQALARVVPAFQAAARRARKVEQVHGERVALGAVVSAVAPGAHVAFDPEGRLLWLSAEAEARLGPLLGRGRPLPRVLVEAAARVGALAGEDAASRPAAFTASVPLPGGGAVHADLRLARAPGGERVVIAALSPPPEPGLDPVAEVAAARGLTKAEAAVLACLGEGLSNKAIAERLFVSIETVKTHVQRILAKLGVASRTQAAVLVNGRITLSRDARGGGPP